MTPTPAEEQQRIAAVREHVRRQPHIITRLSAEAIRVIAERIGLIAQDRRDDDGRK